MANLSNINNKFIVTDGGNVLIGRTSATGTSKLQVTGSLLIGTDINSGIPLVVQETTADGFAIGFMRNTNSTNGNGLVIDVNSTGGAYIQDWRQAGTVKMRLLQNGNLGIGTDSPDAKLEVASGQAKTVTSGVEFARFGTSNEASNYATLTGEVKGGAAAADRKWIFQTIEAGVANAGNIAFQPSGGKVGIGTDSPLKPLHVFASDGAGNIRLTRSGTSEYHDIGTYYSYTNGNSADFGTTSVHKTFLTTASYNALEINPQQEVSLLGYRGADGFALPQDQNTGYSNFSAGGFGILFRETRDNYILGNAYYYKTGGTAGWRAKYSAYGATLISSDGDLMQFQNAPAVAGGSNLTFTPRLNIIANGHVGIGTISPGYKLEVNGNIRSSTVTVYDGMGGTETGIGASGAGGYLRLYSAGVNRVTVQSNAQTLSVFGEDTVGSNYIQFLNSAGTAQGYIGMGAGAANDFIINCESSSVPMRFFNGGSERMRIESGGNVGIGITNPSSKLVIKGDGTYNSTFQRAGATVEIISDELTNNIWSPVFNITNVRQSLTTGKDSFGGIGFSSIDDSNNAGVFDAARIALINESPGAVVTPTALAFYTNTPTTQTSAATERLRITAAGIIKAFRGNAGDLFFADNTSSAGGGIINYNSSLAQQSNNTSCSHFKGTTQNIASYHLYGNGSSSWSSDSRLKRDIKTTRNGYIDDINKLRVVKYKWKNDENSGQELGLIAQEVEKIFPSLVVDNEDAVGNGKTYKSLKYSILPTILLKGMQEQQKMIQELKAEIELLKNK